MLWIASAARQATIMKSMKAIRTIVSIAAMPACLSLADAASVNGQPELNECKKQFGPAGTETKVFGFLPLQGDYYYGSVIIGKQDPIDPESETAQTRFTSGSFTYYQHKQHKDVQLVLDTDPKQVPPSACADYINELHQGVEVVQFNLKGISPPVYSTSWALNYHSIGPFACYLGSDNGMWRIVLMCKMRLNEDGSQRQFDYGYEVINEIRNVLFGDESANVPATVCNLLKNGRVNGVKGRYSTCIENIVAQKTAEFVGSFNGTLISNQ